MVYIDDRNLFINKTLLSDLFQTYLNDFIDFGNVSIYVIIYDIAMKQKKITKDNLMHL